MLLGFNGALIGGRLYAHLGIGVPVIFTGLLIGAALLGRWWYSSHRHSLRAMLLLFQLTGWSFALSIWSVPLGASYFTGSTPYYVSHWMGIASTYSVLLLGLSVYYAGVAKTIRQQYAAFRLHCSSGIISADELYAILTVSRRSRNLLSRLAPIIGVSVPVLYIVGLAVSHAAHRDIREVLGVILCFAASVFVAAILAARLWLQWSILGRNDLLITE